jgi:hypothetical protein
MIYGTYKTIRFHPREINSELLPGRQYKAGLLLLRHICHMLLKTIHDLFGTWDGICFQFIEYSRIFFKNSAISEFGLTIPLMVIFAA